MNEDAFRTFYEATRLPLRSYVLRTSGDADLADDIVQESFIRLLGADTSRLDDEERRRYLYRIATNLLHDHRRRSGRRDVASDEEAAGIPDDASEPFAGDDISAALSRLPETQRALVWLAYVDGYSHREIAGMLKLKERSIRVLLHRARTKLIQLLQEVGVIGNE